jgi:hypothetical protein
MEKAGAEMLARRPDLRQAFEERVRTDSAFASNPDARLNWLYQHSPWSDSTAGVYPVGRLQSREK